MADAATATPDTKTPPPAGDPGAQPPAGGAQPPAGDGGNGHAQNWPSSWRDLIAAGDDKERKQLDRYASPTDVWRKARALEQRMSAGELKSVLPKDATPEQVSAWRKENGVPEKPEDYDTSVQGVEYSDYQKEAVGRLQQGLHAINAPAPIAKAVAEWAAKETESRRQQIAEEDAQFKQTAEDALRAEWGGDYRTHVNLIAGLLDNAPAGLKDRILGGRLADGKPLGSDPDFNRWLAAMARQANPIATLPAGRGGITGIDDRIREIEKVMKEDRGRYNKDEAMQAELRQLYDARTRMAG